MNSSSKNPKKWALYNYPNEIQGKGENFKANSSGSFVFGQQTSSEFTAIDENFVGALGFVPKIKSKVTGLETGILSQPCKSPGYPSKFNTKFKNNFTWTWTQGNHLGICIVATILSQGTCGDCWIFGNLAMVSSSIALKAFRDNKKSYYVSLSPQWILNNMAKYKYDAGNGWECVDKLIGNSAQPCTVAFSRSSNPSCSGLCECGGNCYGFGTLVTGCITHDGWTCTPDMEKMTLPGSDIFKISGKYTGIGLIAYKDCAYTCGKTCNPKPDSCKVDPHFTPGKPQGTMSKRSKIIMWVVIALAILLITLILLAVLRAIF